MSFDGNGNLVESEIPYNEDATSFWASVAVTVIATFVVRVVDGIIVEFDSQEGWWVGEAAKQLLGKPYVEKINIDCNVYPPNSYEGAMCRAV